MNNNLPKGTFSVGNKLYGECQKCGAMVQFNKFLFGSLHVCAESSPKTPQERTLGHFYTAGKED